MFCIARLRQLHKCLHICPAWLLAGCDCSRLDSCTCPSPHAFQADTHTLKNRFWPRRPRFRLQQDGPTWSFSAVPVSPFDNFYSPTNFEFYAREPYDALEKSSHTIRLLTVKKDECGELQYTLRDSVPLTEADGAYTAISYCAGDPKKTRSLLVNGLRFNAFTNLAHAIEETYSYRVREYDDVEATLWTDHISINQSNPAERSHQVRLMYKIYSGAREVAVCLSTDEHRGGSAVAWLKELYQLVGPNGDKRQREFLESCRRRYEADMSGWDDLLHMLQQPWWSRAWVGLASTP